MCWQVPNHLREAVALAPASLPFPGLSPRLAAVAHAVPQGSRVADIGADHGLLAKALLRAGRASYAAAIDLSPAALAGARAALTEEVESGTAAIHEGDGLDPLSPNEVNVAVLAGMGGRGIIDILTRGRTLGHAPPRVVAQANTYEAEVRASLLANGYGITEESLTLDSGRLFLTMTFDLGEGVRSLDSVEDRYVGPLLRQTPGPLLDAWLTIQLDWLQAKCKNLESRDDAPSRRARERLAAIQRSTA